MLYDTQTAKRDSQTQAEPECADSETRTHEGWGLVPNFDCIPAELQTQPWGVWKAEPRVDSPGKMNKAPRCPRTGQKISTTRPEQWGTFEEARIAYQLGGYSGVGVLLIEGSGVLALDIDCRLDLSPEHLALKEALDHYVTAGGYLELSPSGNGYHAYFKGALEDGCIHKAGGIELYDRRRFMTVTGHRLEALDD
jgi:putative DNA primase/helicase